MKEKSGEMSVRVGDQFSKCIQEKRSSLIPILIQAKSEGTMSYISYDKLFIHGEVYSGSGVQKSQGCQTKQLNFLLWIVNGLNKKVVDNDFLSILQT